MSKVVALLILVAICSGGANEDLSFDYSFVEALKLHAVDNPKVTDKCNNQVKALRDAYAKKVLWARKMIDATGKFPSGFLNGNIVSFGTFDQCLSINEDVNTPNGLENIRGKFCYGPVLGPFFSNVSRSNFTELEKPHQGHFNLNRPNILFMNYIWMVCFPADCTLDDLTQISLPEHYFYYPINSFCQEKSDQKQIGGGDIAVLTILSFIIALMVASTIYDILLHQKEKKAPNELLVAFSIYSNGKKLFAISKNPNQISCINGIRVITMMWIILGHRYVMYINNVVANVADATEWTKKDSSMFVIGSTVSVDTFLVLSGIVVTYAYLMARSKGVRFNVFLFYIHRYLRLTPAFFALILFQMTLLENVGSGPLWPSTYYYVDICRRRWWAALIYLQNYLSQEHCIAHSWYLSVDFQLFVISPILLWPMTRSPKIALGVTSFLAAASMITAGVIGWVYELIGMQGGGIRDREGNYLKYYYNVTHTRATPWFIGIMVGYLLFQIKSSKIRIKLPKWAVYLLWLASLTVLATCVYAGNDMLWDKYDRLANAFYLALMRPSWAIALSWVIVACASGNGAPVNWFLSWPIFEILSRFTYSMYLLHPTIILLHAFQIRVAPWFSNYTTMFTFWSDFCLTFLVSILWVLAFESPILIIEKLIFGPRKGTRTTRPNPVSSSKSNVAAHK